MGISLGFSLGTLILHNIYGKNNTFIGYLWIPTPSPLDTSGYLPPHLWIPLDTYPLTSGYLPPHLWIPPPSPQDTFGYLSSPQDTPHLLTSGYLPSPQDTFGYLSSPQDTPHLLTSGYLPSPQDTFGYLSSPQDTPHLLTSGYLPSPQDTFGYLSSPQDTPHLLTSVAFIFLITGEESEDEGVAHKDQHEVEVIHCGAVNQGEGPSSNRSAPISNRSAPEEAVNDEMEALFSLPVGVARDQHALDYKKGGLIIQRHNEIRDCIGDMATQGGGKSPRSQLSDRLIITYGNWGKQAHNTFSRLTFYLAIHQSSPKSSVVAEIYGQLNMTLKVSTYEELLSVITTLENTKICIGHPDVKYYSLLRHRNGLFFDRTGTKLQAYKDAVLLQKPTIRATDLPIRSISLCKHNWRPLCGKQYIVLKDVVFRRFLSLHGTNANTVVHKVPNKYASDGRFLYFFSDPPHLIKTTRNCLASAAKLMQDKAKSLGLSLLKKIKLEHIKLTSFSKMRVDLAAQVLSESVSKAVELIGGVEAAETAKFLIMFDKFFDCLNVSNCSEGHQQRKAFREPYRSADDFRLKWLEEDFLGYISDWETYVKNIDGVSQKMRQKMLLSPQTLLGLKMTDTYLL
eukprot:Em0005g1056a